MIGDRPVSKLEQVMALRVLLDEMESVLRRRAQELLDVGCSRTRVAEALGISRAELYRSFRIEGRSTASEQGQAV